MTPLDTDLDDVPAPKGQLTLKLLASRQDTNLYGDIPGGWLVNQMDQAAELAAGREAGGRTATVAIEAMDFLSCAGGLYGERVYSSARHWPQLHQN